MLHIEQDALCSYCEQAHEYVSRETCEGRFCSEAEEAYLGKAGIIMEKRAFGALRIGDTIYRIIEQGPGLTLVGNTIQCIKSVAKTTELVIILDSGASYTIAKGSQHDEAKAVFINKQEAIKAFKERVFTLFEEMMKIAYTF